MTVKPQTWSEFAALVGSLDRHEVCDDPNCSATTRSCHDCGGPIEVSINRNRPEIQARCQRCKVVIVCLSLEKGGN